MNSNRLTWFDWALIIIGAVLLAHMPVLIAMHRDAGVRAAAEAPFLARGVKIP